MNKAILHIYDYLASHKTFCKILFAAIVISVALPLSMLRFNEDIADFLPQNETNAKYSAVFGLAGGQSEAVVVFAAPDSASEQRLSAAMEQFSRLWSEADTSRTFKLRAKSDMKQIRELTAFISSNYPYFLTDEDYARIDSLLSGKEYVQKRAAYIKEALRKPSAAFTASYLRSDPLLLFGPVLQRLHNLQVGEKFKTVDGYVFDTSGQYGFIFITTPFSGSETANNHALYELCGHCCAQVMEDNPGTEIFASGTPVISVSNANRIKSDSVLAFSLSAIIILGLLIYALRKPSYLFWTAIACISGFLCAMSVLALVKGGMSVIVLGLGSVILGIAVNYPLHYLDHLKHSPDKRTALKEIAAPLLVGNITTVAAFLCLVVLNAAALRDLGLFASVSLVGTMLFVVVFLPQFCTLPRRDKTAHKVENWINRLGTLLSPETGIAKTILFVIIAVMTTIFALTGDGDLFSPDMNRINYMDDGQKRALEILSGLRQESHDKRRLYVVAEGPDMEKALQNNEIILDNIKGITGDEAMRINGVSDFVISKRKQADRLQAWDCFKNRHASLTGEFEHACEAEGLNPRLFSPLLDLFTQNYECRDASFFALVDSISGGHYILQDGNCMVINNIIVPDTAADRFKTDLRPEISDAGFVFDTSDISSRLADNLASGLDYIGYVCAAVVFIFLCLSFGRLEISLISFLPLAVSWIWITGVMHIFDIRFNIVNIILATFIFGQGDDYTIFITEGLMHRNAYGSKVLDSYKSSIVLSAAIMLAGMGMLLLAKHPAMYSLGVVATLGMVVVLFMAFYLPPLVFDFLTLEKGKPKAVPVTLKRIAYSLAALLFFLVCSLLTRVYTFFEFTLCRSTEKKRLRLHKLIHAFSGFVIKRVPGVAFEYENRTGEDFSSAAMIVCNHQSHLDLMCLLSLHPKIVILTNDWVWRNPLYSHIIHNAEFYPVSDGIETNEKRLAGLVSRGYSIVVFPEGTRTADGNMGRFHQGAFYLAQKLRLDIVPVMLHGAFDVLPKTDFMLREGKISMQVCPRIPHDSFADKEVKQITKEFHRRYCLSYAEYCKTKEDCSYFKPLVGYSYLYKGREAETDCRRCLSKFNLYDALCRDIPTGSKSVAFLNSGYGEFALAYALSHKDRKVFACEQDGDKRLLAENCACRPVNFISLSSPQDIPSDCIDIVDLNGKA